MNLDALYQKLIAAARSNPPSDAVPYAFEKRIVARLAAQPLPDPLALWAQAFTRAAIFCVIVALGLSGWLYFAPAPKSDSLSQDVQKTLFAAVDGSGAADGVDEAQ